MVIYKLTKSRVFFALSLTAWRARIGILSEAVLGILLLTETIVGGYGE
jgi:hypothetical protein